VKGVLSGRGREVIEGAGVICPLYRCLFPCVWVRSAVDITGLRDWERLDADASSSDGMRFVAAVRAAVYPKWRPRTFDRGPQRNSSCAGGFVVGRRPARKRGSAEVRARESRYGAPFGLQIEARKGQSLQSQILPSRAE
jgi:hypothetical protein